MERWKLLDVQKIINRDLISEITEDLTNQKPTINLILIGRIFIVLYNLRSVHLLAGSEWD